MSEAIFYADDRNSQIKKVSYPGYEIVATFELGFVPNGMACGPDDKLYVADAAGHIRVLSPVDGSQESTFVIQGNKTFGVTVGPDGVVYVCSPGRFEKYTSGGTLLFSSTSCDIAQLLDPDDMAWDESGTTPRLAVSDARTDKIYYASPATGNIIGNTALGYSSDDIGIEYNPASGEIITSGGLEGYYLICCMDATGSMRAADISTAKTKIISAANMLVAEGYDFVYGVIEFKDWSAWRLGPEPGVQQQFNLAITNIIASGGGDCPEWGLNAIMRAVQGIQGIQSADIPRRGMIVTVTDASTHNTPPNNDRLGTISALQSLGAISYIFHGTCGGSIHGNYLDVDVNGLSGLYHTSMSSLDTMISGHMLANHPPVRDDESIRILGGSSHQVTGSVYGLAFYPRFGAFVAEAIQSGIVLF